MIGELLFQLQIIVSNLISETDHVLGRPSVKFRKYQVLLVLAFWSTYLYKYALQNGHSLVNVLMLY
jgi:hypothetical protein